MKKLKKHWGIDSNFQIIIILIVFSITGSASLFVGKPILDFFELSRESFNEGFWGGFFYYSLRILIIFPIYQILLVCIGFVFGQFKFFWKFEKKMLSRLGFGFLFTKQS